MQVIKLKNGQIVVGLGNPGLKYSQTRHNLGQEVLKSLDLSELGDIEIKSIDSYMNESGRALGKVLKNSLTTTKDILVIHDELDLPIGEVRLQFGRGSAGNKGIGSIIDSLKTNEFWRLRIGIGPRQNGPADDYVLEKLTSAEKSTVDQMRPQIKELVIKWSKNSNPVV